MARDILDLGADVFDDTVVEAKHRISPKKRNYIIGLSITGVLLIGAITVTVVAANSWLLDYSNLEKIQFYFTPTSLLEEGEEQTLTLYKLDPEVEYPETFRIPEKVQGYKVAHIADGAFSGHSEIKKVIFTQYVESVGKNAFSNCTNLESFTWNKRLTSIGEDAFIGTKYLANLKADTHGKEVIPSGTLIYLGTDYFAHNAALVSNELSDAEKEEIKTKYTITNEDFYSFSDLGITNIVDGVFANNQKISYIDFPDFLTKTGNKTFYSCHNLKGINFKHSKITSIGNSAFAGCQSLKDITFSDILAELGDNAFENTAIEEIPALHKVTSIGQGVFKGCTKLETVIYPASETLTFVPENMFADCTSLQTIHWGDTTDGAIDYITNIKTGAFSNTGFVNFTVPKNVTRILDGTFQGCEELTTLALYGNPTNKANYEYLTTAHVGLWEYENSTLTIDLDGYSKTGTVTITNDTDGVHVKLSKIEDDTYPGTNVEFVIPAASLDAISQYQENPVTNEEEVDVVLAVSDASKYYQLAFYNDTSITVDVSSSFHYDEAGNLEPGELLGITDFYSKSLKDCSNLATIKLYDDSYVDIAGKSEVGTFNFPLSLIRSNNDSYNNNNNYTFENTGAEQVNIPANQTDIGSYSFSKMAHLRRVVFAANSHLERIWSNAFENDVELESISLPDSVVTIRAGAFAGCKSMTSFNFNNAVIKDISARTFSGCESLEHINLPASVSLIQENVFEKTYALDYVFVGTNVATINKYAFNQCRELVFNESTNEYELKAGQKRMPIYMERSYADSASINFPQKDPWFDAQTAFDSYKLGTNEDKIAGISYWKGENTAPVEIKVTNIEQSGTLENASFKAGDEFNPAGLTFKANYDDSTSIANVASAIVWNELKAGDTSATGTYTVGTVTINVVVEGITVAA